MSSPVTLRPFGQVEDLELDLATADRPALVTALLVRCGDAHDNEFWWAQSVGSRTAALLRLLALSGGGEAMDIALSCPQPSCGKPFEVAVAFAALTEDSATAEPITAILSGRRTVVMRRPTGRDLRDWQPIQWRSHPEAVGAMLAALVVDGDAGPEDEPAVSEAIAASDPLVAFTVTCACPSCGVKSDLQVDIEGLALAKFAARQRALLCEIHVLASHYGWSEREILAIAPQRRARYLGLIEGLS